MESFLASAWERMLTIEGTFEGASIFGADDSDRALFVNGKQIANLRHGGLEVRLTKQLIREHRQRLKADGRVELRGSSDWVGLPLESEADVELVLELTRLAVPLYLPPPGVAPKLPPTGADLARRRKFH